MELNLTRRDFLKFAGLAGMGAGIAVACQPAAPAPAPTPTVAAALAGDAGNMDAMHEAGVKKFVELIGKDDKFWKDFSCSSCNIYVTFCWRRKSSRINKNCVTHFVPLFGCRCAFSTIFILSETKYF